MLNNIRMISKLLSIIPLIALKQPYFALSNLIQSNFWQQIKVTSTPISVYLSTEKVILFLYLQYHLMILLSMTAKNMTYIQVRVYQRIQVEFIINTKKKLNSTRRKGATVIDSGQQPLRRLFKLIFIFRKFIITFLSRMENMLLFCLYCAQSRVFIGANSIFGKYLRKKIQ